MEAWGSDLERLSALATSPAFAQLQETAHQASLTATLPAMSMPKLINDDTLAAISKAFDASGITDSLLTSPALLSLSDLLGEQLRSASTANAIFKKRSLDLGSILDELSVVADELLLSVDLQAQSMEGDVEVDAATERARAVGTQVTLLLLVLLALAAKSTPGSQDAVVWFGRHLLEETVFLGKATHAAYLELSKAMPDDNVLGWAATFALLVRWLKGTSDDGSGPGQR